VCVPAVFPTWRCSFPRHFFSHLPNIYEQNDCSECSLSSYSFATLKLTNQNINVVRHMTKLAATDGSESGKRRQRNPNDRYGCHTTWLTIATWPTCIFARWYYVRRQTKRVIFDSSLGRSSSLFLVFTSTCRVWYHGKTSLRHSELKLLRYQSDESLERLCPTNLGTF
jgi:hypothetical protein